MMNEVSKILRGNNFSIYEIKKKSWEPMKNVAIVPDKQKIKKIIDERWYLGSEPNNKKLIIDVLGCLHDNTKFDYDKTIAVEVSFSSDIKNEILKLKNIPTKWKVVVTENISGELEGIPVIAIGGFREFVQAMLKDARG